MKGVMRRCGAALAAVVLVAACDLTTGPRASLQASVEDGEIELVNTTRRHAYYFVVNTDALPLMNWAQCVGAGCPGMGAGERAALPLEAPLRDGGESRQLTIYWWHAEAAPDGGLRPGRLYIRTVSVD
jgi:hypothetical protein